MKDVGGMLTNNGSENQKSTVRSEPLTAHVHKLMIILLAIFYSHSTQKGKSCVLAQELSFSDSEMVFLKEAMPRRD